jgi:hypothetical protein
MAPSKIDRTGRESEISPFVPKGNDPDPTLKKRGLFSLLTRINATPKQIGIYYKMYLGM